MKIFKFLIVGMLLLVTTYTAQAIEYSGAVVYANQKVIIFTVPILFNSKIYTGTIVEVKKKRKRIILLNLDNKPIVIPFKYIERIETYRNLQTSV